MDIEQILTQILIALVTVIFFIFACRVKSNIEKRYRKGTENLKHSKQKMKEILVKQTILCKKVMCESTNRHHRSIIAASLKQTLDEEMEKLEHIKDSIKLVKQMPDLKPSFHQFVDRDFFPEFGGVSVFNLGSKEVNSDKNEKCLVRAKDSRLQTKLCNEWRARSRRFLKNNYGKVKKESKKKWNDFKDRRIMNGQFYQLSDKHIQALTNFTVNNVSIINFRDNHIKGAKETVGKIMEVESCENNSESMEALPDLKSDIANAMQDITHMFSCNDLSNSEKEQDVCNHYTKKRDLYRTGNSNSDDINSESVLCNALDENHKSQNQLFVEKSISCRHIRHVTSNGKNRAFQFDLVYCSGKESGVKIVLELKNNKSLIYYDTMEESVKVVNLNMFQISTKKIGNNTNTLMRYVFKISLKINKKKVVLKCLISCFDKEKQEKKRLSYRAKQQLQSNTNCCRVQSKHRSLNKKAHKKRHSLYTDTSLLSTEERKSRHSDDTYYSAPLAEGDITQNTLDDNRQGSVLCDTGDHAPNFGDQRSEMDRAILKQCVQLTRDCVKDYKGVPQLVYRQTKGNQKLSTIEEETADDSECFEKITAKVCPTVKSENEHYQRHEEQRLVEFDRNESIQLPLFYNKSEVYRDKSQIESEIYTALNLKASQLLEKMNAIKLKETNSSMSNTPQMPKNLTCVFELRSYDETMYTQNIFMNRFYDEMLNKEETSIMQSIFQNRQPSSTNCSDSSTSRRVDNKDQNDESQIIEYKEPMYNLDKIIFEKEVVLGGTTTNSIFMEKTVFVNNESDELHFNIQNTSSPVIVVEGAVFSSSDDSATVIWDEHESQTDLSDDELSKTSESN